MKVPVTVCFLDALVICPLLLSTRASIPICLRFVRFMWTKSCRTRCVLGLAPLSAVQGRLRGSCPVIAERRRARGAAVGAGHRGRRVLSCSLVGLPSACEKRTSARRSVGDEAASASLRVAAAL